MAQFTLIIDTSTGNLLTSLSNQAIISPSTIPLYFGDTLMFNVYLMTPILNPNPGSGFNFQNVGTAGLALFMYLDDGTIGGTIYTQEINWNTDPSNSFFFANLALNTMALQTLIATATSASAYFKVGYVQNGYQTTVFSARINVEVGLPLVNLVVPAGQTALSVEVAKQTFFPLQPVPGQALLLASPLGKIIQLVVVDNPADGSYSLEENNLS